jgi:hypothetical protein
MIFAIKHFAWRGRAATQERKLAAKNAKAADVTAR